MKTRQIAPSLIVWNFIIVVAASLLFVFTIKHTHANKKIMKLEYIIENIDYYAEGAGILRLKLDGKKINGDLHPLLGHGKEIIKIQGQRISHDEIELKLPGLNDKVIFQKHVEDRKIIWVQTPNFGQAISFFRPQKDRLSFAQKSLTKVGCGGPNMPLIIKPKKKIDEAAVKYALQILPVAISKLKFSICEELTGGPCHPYQVKFGKLVARLSSKPDNFENFFRLEVPVGTESHVAVALRKTHIFDYVNLEGEACFGIGAKYLSVSKSYLFGSSKKYSDDKFFSFIKRSLKKYVLEVLKKSGLHGSVGMWSYRKYDIPPHYIAVQALMYLPSEYASGHKGGWDKFFVSIIPNNNIDLASQEFGLTISIERLRTTSRPIGVSTPPNDNWFTRELTFSDEEVVAIALKSFFLNLAPGRCVHDVDSILYAEGRSEQAKKALEKCS